MRKPRIMGLVLACALLGACGDPSGGDGKPAGPTVTHRGAALPSPSGAAPASGAAPDRAAAPAKAPVVLYLGDSLAMENQEVLGRELRDAVGARYRAVPYSGTTLCDYLEGTAARSLVPARDKAAALVRALRPDYVVLQFWGNAWGYTPCMDGVAHDRAKDAYVTRYAADAERLTRQIADAGRAGGAGGAGRPRVVWVLQGPDPVTPDRVRRVNAVYERQAGASGDLVADAGAAVSPASARYTWAQYLPCTEYEREHPEYCTGPGPGRAALHRDDDHLHFCLAPMPSAPRPCPVRSPGTLRMARAIAQAVADDVTRRSPAPPTAPSPASSTP
ncbi:hypothetical protein GCM10010145_19370 [Streptomyces ruber]|uniref:SGNH/GDSL hydrolase family protein n=2 Tax=Streptomyces TaxID=1883 RepID=A0A918BBT1_9ACTN|nr:SGNH/GDSL hydrolase family protein [Streptomyces ruber]GGQ50490.1 hypothetical protein GCM10010145_19370 [Streptomyces ruber]